METIFIVYTTYFHNNETSVVPMYFTDVASAKDYIQKYVEALKGDYDVVECGDIYSRDSISVKAVTKVGSWTLDMRIGIERLVPYDNLER